MGCRHKSGRLCLCFGQLHRIHDRRRSDHNPETDPTLARFAYVPHLCRRQSGTHDRLGRTHRRFRHRPDASDPGPVMHQRRSRRRGRRHMASRQRRHRLCLQIQRRDAMDRSRSRRIENHQERIRSGSEKHLYHIRQGPTARFGGFGGAYASVPADRHFGGRMGKDFRRKPVRTQRVGIRHLYRCDHLQGLGRHHHPD